MAGRILVIDDDEAILESCRTILEDEGYQVKVARQPEKGLALLEQETFDLALIDLKMQTLSGLEVLEKAAAISPDLVMIIFTAYATIESAVAAIKNGAFNYLSKPFTASQLAASVNVGLEHSRLQRDNMRLRQELEERCPEHQIIGRSPAIERVLTSIRKVAGSDANVLVTGESGTGKELVARAILASSLRADGPFIPVDCAALPANLLESELFGHERGAFTGAINTKRGLLELAHGGTLFLDEIGELSLELQAKLLRTLQERAFRRLGGERLINVDIRLVSSTNRDLTAEVREGRFRQDLLYRLNVVTIKVPPLRDREGDIALLVQHYLHEFGEKGKKQSVRITPEALRLLGEYRWPGNVRELRNIIERAVVLCDDKLVGERDLPECVRDEPHQEPTVLPLKGYKEAREQWLGLQGKQYLTSLLRRYRGNISAVAREAQISRKAVYELIRRFEIDPEQIPAEN